MDERILVVTACTGKKRFSKSEMPTLLEQNDFVHSSQRLRKEQELAAYMTDAANMYTGRQHLLLMKGIEKYRQAGRHNVDLKIVSAGYGLLKERDSIFPYEVTFNGMGKTQIKKWSNQLSITQNLQQEIEQYSLVFFLLGDKYLQAIEWPLRTTDHQQLIFFAGPSSKSLLTMQPNASMIEIGKAEAIRYGAGLVGIKGHLFAKLLEYMSTETTASWMDCIQNPGRVREYLLESLEEPNGSSTDDYLRFHKIVPEFIVNKGQEAQNYQTELKYYIPENDDRVDPKFDFELNVHQENRLNLEHDFYAHDFYDDPQYDGILISKINIDNATSRKKELIEQNGIRKFLRLPETAKIMGDCGAFSYLNSEVPPYSTEDVLDYYHSMGFDFGVSVDHLIVGSIEKDIVERQRRYDITMANAEDFMIEHKKDGYRFTPIGVAQGWDPDSFRDAVKNLINMGYTYVALGGLAKEKSTKIFEILKKIAPEIKDSNFRMHLFGVAREMEIMKSFHKLGVTSFDSASPLRRAWLDSRHNYYTSSGKTYTALRIPEAKMGKGRFKELDDQATFDAIKTLETEALTTVRNYGNNGYDDIQDTLEAVLAYDKHLGGNRKHHQEAYRALLEEKPWEKCGCPICQDIGIDVVIFRGNNRNRRRGFHNTHVYYQQLRALRKDIFE